MNDKTKEIQTAGEIKIVTKNDKGIGYAVFEQVYPDIDGKPEFIYHEQSGNFRQNKPSITIDTETSYIPIEKYLFPKTARAEDYRTLDALYDEVYNYIYAHVDLTNPAHYHILTCFVLLTWRAEDFDSVPYLLFLGEFMSGKSRALEVLQELCYRALKTSSISSAAVVRLLQKHRITLLCDETDILNSESKFELVHILNAGYKTNDFYIRADPDSDDIQTWKTFGPKALAGTSDFNKALNSRCVEIPMSRASRKVNLKIDREQAAKIREKLLDYRLKNVKQPLPLIEPPFHNGRNHELFTPLAQLAPEQHRQIIIEYGLGLEKQRMVEDSVSFEGDVLQSVLDVMKTAKSDRLKVGDVYEAYKILPDVDSETVNKRVDSFKNRIGRVLKNKFHLERAWDKSYYIDLEKIERLKERYKPNLIESVGSVDRLDIYTNETHRSTNNTDFKDIDHELSPDSTLWVLCSVDGGTHPVKSEESADRMGTYPPVSSPISSQDNAHEGMAGGSN